MGFSARYHAASLAAVFFALAIGILIDSPLMLLGGPMKMSLGEYMGDIGLTYLGIPMVTTALGIAQSRVGGRR